MAYHDAHETMMMMMRSTAKRHPPPPKERAPRKKIKFTPLALQRLKPPKTGQTAYWDTTDGLSLLVSYGGSKAFRASFPLAGRYVFVTIGRSGHGPRGCPGHGLRLPFEGPARHRPPDPGTIKNDVRGGRGRLHSSSTRNRGSGHCADRTNSEKWMRRMAGPADASITKKDAYKLLDQFVADGTPHKARVTLAWLQKTFGVGHGNATWSRHRFLDWSRSSSRKNSDRVYTDAEIKAMWGAADQLEPAAAAYFKLLLLLAPRKSALAGMRWSDIKDDVWVTPFELTKSRKTAKPRTYQTPLPPLAMRIMSGLPHNADRVFAGMTEHRRRDLRENSFGMARRPTSSTMPSATPWRRGCRTKVIHNLNSASSSITPDRASPPVTATATRWN